MMKDALIKVIWIFSFTLHTLFLGLDIVYPVMGEDFALNCSYSANPSVSAGVIWYKNGNPVDFQTTPHTNITQDGSVMQIIKCKCGRKDEPII